MVAEMAKPHAEIIPLTRSSSRATHARLREVVDKRIGHLGSSAQPGKPPDFMRAMLISRRLNFGSAIGVADFPCLNSSVSRARRLFVQFWPGFDH